MSEEMIERVARAIGTEDGHSLTETDYLNMARAAIEAMREPTDAMAEFAEDNFDRDADNIRVCHRAFITAALAIRAIPVSEREEG